MAGFAQAARKLADSKGRSLLLEIILTRVIDQNSLQLHWGPSFIRNAESAGTVTSISFIVSWVKRLSGV